MPSQGGKTRAPRETAAQRRERQAEEERVADLRGKATDADRRIELMRRRYSELENEMVQVRNVIHELIGRRGVYAEELGEEPPLSVIVPLPDPPDPAPELEPEPDGDG